MRSDFKKVMGIVLASAATLSLSSALIVNSTPQSTPVTQTSRVVSAATTPTQIQPSSLMQDYSASNIKGTTPTPTVMFSNGHHWLKLGYNQWSNDDGSASNQDYQYIPVHEGDLELNSNDDTTSSAINRTDNSTSTIQSNDTKKVVNLSNQSQTSADDSENRSNSVASGTPDPGTSTVSVNNVVAQPSEPQQTTDTLQIAGYTVKYLDNISDTPNVNDGNNYHNLPLQSWLNEQDAGVWNINANQNNHITDQAEPIFSTTDNKNSYFIGHNIGAFTPLMQVNMGDVIHATDSTNQSKDYKISAIYRLPASNSGNQWIDLDTGQNVFNVLYAGTSEKITLQTCIDESSIRIVVADAI